MYCNASHGGSALRARGVTALLVTLAMGLLVGPSAAAPFAFVANTTSNSVSVIDTATTPPSVVATVLVGPNPLGVAGTPDGTHAYVANFASNTVSVLDATTIPPTVVATISSSRSAVSPVHRCRVPIPPPAIWPLPSGRWPAR